MMTNIYIQQKWPAQDLVAICQLQDIAANGNAIFNGTLMDPMIPDQVSFIGAGFIRNVSISSANDLSGVIFTVTGIQNGVPITEGITGPVATGTMFGALDYDVITSITVNGNVAGVTIGTGNVGFLPLIGINTKGNSLISFAISTFLPLEPLSGINYNIYGIVEKIFNNGYTLAQMIGETGQIYNSLDNGTQSNLNYQLGNPISYVLISISASTPLTDTLTLTFQQA